MAVRFHVPANPPLGLVSFAWSPLLEALLSLRAVAHPKRAPLHLPWARRCRDLPAELRAEIDTLVVAFDRYVPGIFEVGLLGRSPDFHDELSAFRALDDETITFEMSLSLGGIACGHGIFTDRAHIHDEGYRAEVSAAVQGTEREALLRQAFDDPAALKERMARMLEGYWDEAFAEEWERIRPRIEVDVNDGARALITRGVPGLVDELLPEGVWDEATGTVVVDKDWDGDCDVVDRGGMLFVPTVYGWPCVLLEVAPAWPVAVIFPLRDLRQPEVPTASDHEVADGLRALGDETRLQITRLVAEQPRSTKELAELLRLSDSAVSRHLKILAGAGLVDSERDGYFVLYRLRPERIGELGGALRHTLGLSQARPDRLPPLPVSVARVPEG